MPPGYHSCRPPGQIIVTKIARDLGLKPIPAFIYIEKFKEDLKGEQNKKKIIKVPFYRICENNQFIRNGIDIINVVNNGSDGDYFC